MSVVAVILGKERRMVGRFEAAGALSREHAKTLEQLGVHRGVILRRLRERAVVREASPGHYYLDEESWAAVRRMRRRATSILGIVLLVLLFVGVFLARRAQAGPTEAGPYRGNSAQIGPAEAGSYSTGGRLQPASIDSIFERWNKPDSSGCALGIYQDGAIVYERGYGTANLELDVPITPATVFYVGSLSKQFTAMAAALAIQQGRLSADDSIRRWLPEMPAYADAITVRHLVHHTSGLRDYNTLLLIAGRRGDEAYDNPTVLRMAARQKALNFEPGTEYLYSNTGYTLLALIVERAAKTPFADYADEQIFKPLGMTVTHFHTDNGRLVKGRAAAYVVTESGVRLDTPSNERAGAGGVFTSVRDLLHWDENFYTGRVGGKALIEQLQTPGRLKNGNPLVYAWGLNVGTYRGAKVVEHGGSLGGYRAHLTRFPDHHTSIAVLCNVPTGPNNLVRRVADVVLAGKLAESAAAAETGPSRRPATLPASGKPVDEKALSGYVGTFESDEIDATFTAATKDGVLTLQRDSDADPIALDPAGPDRFRAPGFTIRFEREGDRVTALVVDAGRVRGIRFHRRPDLSPSREALPERAVALAKAVRSGGTESARSFGPQ